jgi:hypothetical protein
MLIDNAFSDPFWDCWITAINHMRFCRGLGGKSDAYVRCSSHEDEAIFTTAGRFTYHALPLTDMEEKIISLACFVMSFQRAFVESLYGNDYCVTWDVNLLHHIVGPIASAVYSAHSDFSPLICSLNKKESVHIHKDVHLPVRDEMQVLTIYCSNAIASIKDKGSLTIKYTYDGSSIGSATLGSRGIHIQGPGSQSPLLEHAVTTNACQQSGIYRCVCTTRLTVVPRNGKSFSDHKELERATTFEGIDHLKCKSDYNKMFVVKHSNNRNLGKKQYPQSKRSHTNFSREVLRGDDTADNNTRNVK